MEYEIKDKSKALEIIERVWHYENSTSYLQLNNLMQKAMQLTIEMNLKFNKEDFDYIFNTKRGSRWFGVSRNGRTQGENFYSLACKINNSAAISFEYWAKRKPFILNEKKLHEGSLVFYGGMLWRVTGFCDEDKKIFLVLQKKQKATGSKKLLQFDNKEFLSERAYFKPY